jgi:polyisoprenoid-binding protein YceI
MPIQQWIIDPMHSEIMFKVRHMLITNVSGTFDMYQATMLADAPDFSDMQIQFEAEVSSINTRNDHRDDHLRSNDFFDAINNPSLRFESTGIRRKEANIYDLDGTFTIRGVQKTITLKVEFTGTALDLYGQRKAGFEISGLINRNDFGLTWNATTEDGGLALAEEVQLAISAQMIKQA